MSLQQVVNRAYTTAFAGQLTADGPRRAKPGRILSATGNHMSRAFSYAGEMPDPTGPELGVAYVAEVNVGGAEFFGILGNPQVYALRGAAGDPLAPSMDLPQGDLGEFFDMATGICVELFNETTATKAVNFGDSLAYVTAAGNANGVPIGGLIAVAAGGAAPSGAQLIPNARIMRTISLGASAAGAAVSALTIVQLTQ